MNEKFLELYQQIEYEIKENYPEIIFPGQNVVASLSNLEQFKGREDLLFALRNIRNTLAHAKKINGQDIITVNECFILFAENILRELREPQFVEYDKKCKTLTMESKVNDVFKILKTKKLIPVLNSEKQVIGVLSTDILPEILCSKKYTENAMLKDFKKLLRLDSCVFVKPEISRNDLNKIVEQNKLLGIKINRFILTADGTNKGKFVSIIEAKTL